MTTTNLLKLLYAKQIQFKDILAHIDDLYFYRPTAFRNGPLANTALENQGSARVFYFAKCNDLTKEDTLALFAEHYVSVLNDPAGVDHQNIRNFQRHGWEGISFDGVVLDPR